MSKRGEWIGMLTLVCVLLGVLLGLSVKTQQEVRRAVPNVANSVELSQEWDVMQHKIILLQNRLQEVTGHPDPSSQEGRLAMLAGTVPATGPGILVTLRDNPQVAGQKPDPSLSAAGLNVGIVHDLDILRVVNELNAAGAEVIAINGQRYGPRSAIRCVGPVVNVNQVAIGEPFRVQAIGDPVTLESALGLPGGVVEELRGVGCQVDIQRYPSLKIPPFDGAVLFRYARQESAIHHQANDSSSEEAQAGS